MKKILLIASAILFTSAYAYADIRVGISGAFTSLQTDGTETTKSSGEKNKGSKDESSLIPSIFVEKSMDSGMTFGLDIVPGSADLGSGTGADDDAETSGANKASAEVSGHVTAYALFPVGSNGAYIKGGIARASVDTKETLATGTSYGNETVNGLVLGLGVNRDLSNGLFLRTEASYTNYQEVNLDGSLNGNAVGDSAVRNTIDADVDAFALRISIGKAF